MNIDKLLFFDIECATLTDNYQKDIPEPLKKKWSVIANSFRKRYPDEMQDKSDEEIYYLKGMLYPEFGRVVCVSFGYEDSGECGEFWVLTDRQSGCSCESVFDSNLQLCTFGRDSCHWGCDPIRLYRCEGRSA